MIACERATRAIRPVHAGCEPHDQESRVCRTEWRNRATVIIRVAAVDFVEKPGEPRARAAIPVKNCRIHPSVLHVAYDRPAEPSRADQARTGHEFFEFLLDLFLIVRFHLALRSTYGGT